MNRIDRNNLEALKIRLGSTKGKKAVDKNQQEKTETVKEFEPKKVEASALDAAAAQNWGAQLSKIDVSDAAVERRMAEAFANAPFMKALNEINGIEEEFDFVRFALNNIAGVDRAKLARHLEKPLSQETEAGTVNMFRMLTA